MRAMRVPLVLRMQMATIRGVELRSDLAPSRRNGTSARRGSLQSRKRNRAGAGSVSIMRMVFLQWRVRSSAPSKP